MYFNILRTLFSLKKRDDYPMYSMTYYGDYGFDDFIKQGAKSDDDIRQFVRARLTRGKYIKHNTPDSGCTAFLTKNADGNILFARNYDFSYAPSLVVKTKPRNGYASVSVVDMTILGYSKEQLPKRLSERLPLMASPYLPSDGMNEKGLAIAILQVPMTNLPNAPNKITLNTTTMIRYILDKAATVDEAVAVFSKYNIYFSRDIYCHFFIADKSGKSVIVEYWDGEIHVINEGIASNFIAYNDCEYERVDAHGRYEKVESVIGERKGVLNTQDAASLLCDVGCYGNDKADLLQWSAVYNLSKLTGIVFPCRDMQKQYQFRI